MRLGRPTTLAEAAAAVSSPLLVPADAPKAVFVDDGTGEVNIVFGDGLLLGQFPNARPFFEKLIGGDDETVAVTVDGGRGLWLSGRTHVLVELGHDDATEARPGSPVPRSCGSTATRRCAWRVRPRWTRPSPSRRSLRPYG